MNKALLILLFHVCSIAGTAQDTISNYKANEPVHWGSSSAQEPSAGFYGQEFDIPKDVELYSFSIFIADVSGHDQTKSTINYAVLRFDSKPTQELFLSEPVNIMKSDVGNWKKYTFKMPLKLRKGKYLFAIGQPAVQGFAAFGNGIRKEGYQSGFWMKGAFANSDTLKWTDLNTSMVSNPSASEAQKQRLSKIAVMMQLVYK